MKGNTYAVCVNFFHYRNCFRWSKGYVSYPLVWYGFHESMEAAIEREKKWQRGHTIGSRDSGLATGMTKKNAGASAL